MRGVGIEGVASFIPKGRESTETVVFRNGGNRTESRLLERVHGLKQIPRAEKEEKLEDMLAASARLVLKNEKVDCVFYAHSILSQVPQGYRLLDRTLSQVGLSDVPAFGISQLNCASAIGALSIVERASRQYRRILMLIGDSTSYLPEARHISHSTIMGDAATAVLFSTDTPHQRLLSHCMIRDTRFYPGFYQDREEQREFGRVYQGHLKDSMTQALQRAGVTLSELAWIFPHNVNLTTWRRFCQESGFDRNKVYLELLSDVGHCYCNDAFLNLERAREKGMIRSGDLFAVVGVGIGSYFGTAIFRG